MEKGIYIFLMILISFNSFGQFEEVNEVEDDVSRVHFFEANFSMYLPTGAFSAKLERDVFYGFSLGYLVQLKVEKPSFLGIEAFHMNLGIYSKDYDAYVGSEQLVLTGKVASNVLGFNTTYRHYPPLKFKILEPYFEGQFGVKYLYSYLSEAGTFLDGEPYDNFDLLEGDWVLTYGGAIGLQIKVSDIYYLNLKTTYHLAVSGKYQKKVKDDFTMIDLPQEAFESVQSSTDVIKFDMGFTILF